MKASRLFGVLLLSALPLLNVQGQQLPLANNFARTRYNFQTTNGVPLSNTRGNPPGSDGRAPGPIPGPLGTPGQFQGLLTFGGTVTNRTSATNQAGVTLVFAHRTRIGAPYLGNSFAYLFGAVIPQPSTDEYGVPLSLPNGSRPITTPAEYWNAEPYTTNQHAGEAYYWSPHAEKVYASNPGFVSVRWRKAAPSTPVGAPPGVSTVVIDSRTYTLLTKQEVISASPVKPPRRMYWTEGPFAQIGRPISVPTDRIKDIKIIYNDQLPQFTPLVAVGTNQVRREFPFDGTQFGPVAITNTLWYDRTLNTIRAYNFQDRRVFVEFLGDKRSASGGQDIHQQLGYELVEVIQRPSAADVTTELGERLTPFQGAAPANTPELFADPILQLGQDFVYRHSLAGTPEFDYFAIHETHNQDDYQMHWMEEGLLGLRWPYRYARYKMIWPDDVAKYSHYVRPLVSTEAEAKATAVPLPAQNAPQIAYQDPLDQPRGKLTESFAYYSWLSVQQPAHRALLQFIAGENVRFERVFSWLDTSLRAGTAPVFAPAFDAGSGDGTAYGNATLSNGVLHLTDILPPGNQNGAFVFNDFSHGQIVEDFHASFSMRVSGPGVSAFGQDGFSFNFGNLPAGVASVPSTGISDGLSVMFALGGGVFGALPKIAVNLNGTQVAVVFPVDLVTDTQFVPVEIDLRRSGLLDVTFNGTKLIADVPTHFVPRTGRFGFAGAAFPQSFTGIAQWIDDVSILINRDNAYLSGPAFAGSVATNLAWLTESSGFAVRTVRGSLSACSLDEAENVLGNPVFQAGEYNATAPVINFLNTGGGGRFANDLSYPGFSIGVNEDNFVIVASGTIVIPTNGWWTFGVNSDDGFRCDIGNNWFGFLGTRGPEDTFAQFNLAAGTYPVRLVAYECTLGAEVEFFAAAGLHATFNSAFRLVGDTAAGGLAVRAKAPAPNFALRPRVVSQTATVGQRISAPAGELGSGLDTNYLAGYIRSSEGNSFHPAAYLDPLVSGFELANRGTIIPVNAIPGRNSIEVWWFRKNQVNTTLGFQNTYWPSVLARYTIGWPTDASEIILASNDGSGALPSLESKGQIYFQNNPAQPGYNPNEEHALMQGGQAWALRDDLNLTAAGPSYTSHPFVLLEYTEPDGRIAIRPFRVRREKPEAGITFNYQKRAAQILQPPMPLPLLGVAFAPKLPGVPRKGLNEETPAVNVATSLRDGTNTQYWTLTTDTTNGFLPYWPLALQDTRLNPLIPVASRWFFGTRTSDSAVEGAVSTNRPLNLNAATRELSTGPGRRAIAFSFSGPAPVPPLQPGLALFAVPASDFYTNANIVTCTNCAADEIVLEFSGGGTGDTNNWLAVRDALVMPVLTNLPNSVFNGWRLAWNELPRSSSDPERQKLYASSTVTDRKGNLWVYRGPLRPSLPETFAMQFYYNTLPGFYFPTLPFDAQPPVGTATPYLRKRNKNGQFIGDPVYGNGDDDQQGDRNSLPIVYHPYWPSDAPVLQMAETLTTPKRGLPAVRGQTSLQILYQQAHLEVTNGQLSINPTKSSAVLHDPTREKTVAFSQADLPGSIQTEMSRGKIFFPSLPPHLVKRFWLDPNRGANGMLVFGGEFVDAPLGDKYLLLNVAGSQDAATLRELCPAALSDPKKPGWNNAIDALATEIEKFVENPAVPGTFIPGSSRSVSLGSIPEVIDDDEAVDSYALTATGPDTGYVTLIAGNSLAHTPEGEPVSMEVIRVAPNLYRGEVTVIEGENPLSEKITLQQVVDLAGHAEDYTFDWRITAPVDGQPPVTYSRARWSATLAPWAHVRYPLASDRVASIENTEPARTASDVAGFITPVNELRFDSVQAEGELFRFQLSPGSLPHRLAKGNRLVMSSGNGVTVFVTVYDLPASGNEVLVSVEPGQSTSLEAGQIFRLAERAFDGPPQSIVYSSFVVNPAQDNLTEVWVSLSLAHGLGAKVYLNGGAVATTGFSDVTVNTLPDNPTSLLATPRLQQYFKLPSSVLADAIEGPGGLKTNRLAVELFAPALPDFLLDFQVRVEAIKSTDLVVAGTDWIPLNSSQYEDGIRAVLGGTADVRSLSDNYLTMRYRPNGNPTGWSQWTEPQLAEGWIKRVLKGINPFNQRIADLYNNAVNTDVSILAQAGARWEGNIALNLESMNSYGLIEIYETVMNRGRDLSIDAGINYGPANDALLLAAGYINDLYMLVGNEAAADAANPTIGIGTANHTYSDIATALFSFKGQLPSLLSEELGLLRGRDDFLVPGVQTRPVYNRLVWNYTRGIDAGEVIYALNYNVLDQNRDGKVDASDALELYPQGHGDAYGHYLTALKGYYRLFLNPNFDWVPRSEAVLVLGKPVSVDYQDERKFAAAAGAVARTGRQIFDLTWRQDFRAGSGQGWEHFRPTTTSGQGRTRQWGVDHWASRTAQGAYLNWIAGNAILPYQDPDPAHADTIQQVDRTTVPELKELPIVTRNLQTALDNVDSGLTPLGLPESAVPFDLNPVGVTAGEGNTHFEQIFTRARTALQNAVVAFDDAKDVTRLMRSEEDSLADLRAAVDKQELAYTNALIELFGTPYPEDIGPGRTYRTGFVGPDTIHYMYVDNVELDFRTPSGGSMLVPSEDAVWRIDTQTFTAKWLDKNGISDFSFIQPARNGAVDGTDPLEAWATNTTLYVEYNLTSHGFFAKPKAWTGRRASPGKLQQAISDIAKARNAAFTAFYWADAAKYDLDWAIQSYYQKRESFARVRDTQAALLKADLAVNSARLAWEIFDKGTEGAIEKVNSTVEQAKDTVPDSFIAGLAAGGDIFSGIRAALGITGEASAGVLALVRYGAFSTQKVLDYGNAAAKQLEEFYAIAPEQRDQELREIVGNVRDKVYGMNNNFMTINARLQELDDAQRKYRALLAEGGRIQAEREILRQRTAAVIQGYRTRDAAFRIFRNEKLERYKSLFDLAAQYAYMAAQAYDYETGLLGTDRGREFINRIVNARALGVVKNGQPQFAGSNNGDPGLSSVLAEMAGDWSVVKSRLGFNNPDAYGTTASLRYENFRIINNAARWKEVLTVARKANLLDDPDVRRYCLQIDNGSSAPVPGLILEFSTAIGDGLNLFGHPLSPGDHKFTASSFATKIFAAGVALEGYVGMDDPAVNSGAVAGSGGSSPPDPSLIFLNPDALSANPYLYLIPAGVDSMRSPPLGDPSAVRTWSVDDVAVPLPFNIGGSDYSSARLWQSEDSLTEPPFVVRKHQAFRPVSTSSVFSADIYSGTGGLLRSQFTSNRLIGRSVWNSKWKLIIPGRELLNDPNEGIERFLRTVKDIKLHFVTYSYAGN